MSIATFSIYRVLRIFGNGLICTNSFDILGLT